MLNIGLTALGIAIVKPELNVPKSNFSTTFKKGPWDPNNAQQSLGDSGPGLPGDPQNGGITSLRMKTYIVLYMLMR